MGMNRRSLLGAAGLALGAPAVVTVAQAAEDARSRAEGPTAAGDEDPRGVHPRFLL